MTVKLSDRALSIITSGSTLKASSRPGLAARLRQHALATASPLSSFSMVSPMRRARRCSSSSRRTRAQQERVERKAVARRRDMGAEILAPAAAQAPANSASSRG